MPITDIFPLQNSYPVGRDIYDRKVRVPMPDGDIKIRSRGTDPKVFNLTGWGTIADQTTLQAFYEAQATDIFTFQDKSFDTERDVVVRFTVAPTWEEWFGYMIWRCTLREELVPMAASVAGSAVLAAALSTAITLVSAVSGSGTVSAALTTEIPLAGSVTGSAAVSSELTTEIPLAAAVSGNASVTADLT